MGASVTRQLIEAHLVDGEMRAGVEIALRIDQTLTQDATGTMVMLELEAMGVGQVRTELSAQYVDHNLLQVDYRNADDHLFLRSGCQRFGLWYSKPGNGVSHPVHMQRFGRPGKTLLGADSHTCAAGSLGMLAMGAGGLEVAMAMAGEPFFVNMPTVMGVRLIGRLPDWVSAKDVILEMLRRHGVHGGVGKVIEYHGPGLACLSAMDRHVIANMGAELGATTTVFPSDSAVRGFLESEGRGDAWAEMVADSDAGYDEEDEIDLSSLVPLIALPPSPDNVVAVSEVAGAEICQAVIGSSANPGLRDFAIAAAMVAGRQTHDRVSFDVNPTSRQLIEVLAATGGLAQLVAAGARIHQAGCMGCIGMGQAPASDEISLRTMPRNFPGRSGTSDDKVYLCSPETATASALTGAITDPRTLAMAYPRVGRAEERSANRAVPPAPVGGLTAPGGELVPPGVGGGELRKGPNIAALPELRPLADAIEAPVLLVMGDGVSTDGIMPAGARALPYRSNIPALARFAFEAIDHTFFDRAVQVREKCGSVLVAGKNYGQGSSREHAALVPRYLGVHAVIAVSFARIHWQNLTNFGVLPLTFARREDLELVGQGDVLGLTDLRRALASGSGMTVENRTSGKSFLVEHQLSSRQVNMVLAGGLINQYRQRRPVQHGTGLRSTGPTG
ncbi:MAG: aconitate hydratase [Acidimicrobiales bacterium]|nr:MAG: aconitate hydratase [Acidimicrobiales bacterium]